MTGMYSSKVEKLFADWDEAMIWSCLQGHKGTKLVADDKDNPTAAKAEVGDICFFAGQPNEALLGGIVGEKLLVPQNEAWEKLIEKTFGSKLHRFLRYAIKKEPEVFDTALLTSFVDKLGGCYELRLVDEEIFELARSQQWSVDLCSQFSDYADYKERAVGVAILHNGELVAGASPYAVYNGGIEIEIDTKPEHRERGLATVCGARLILECLARGIYPSWDAHDLRSVALATKLGYHLSHPYTAYALSAE